MTSPVASQNWKEKFMSHSNDNRVLNRMGARQLTSDELEQITGGDKGGPFTRASLTGTGTMLSTDSDMDS